MKPLRPAAAAVILTALLAVPAQADHKRFGGFFVEPFFVPVPERPFRGRLRQQDGYPVARVRQRLRGIGFSGIGQFDVHPNVYGVTATDPGGVRVRLAIDRWTGRIMRARVIEGGPAVRPYRPPVVVDRAPPDTRITRRKIAALRAPPLPRPAPERLTQTARITPSIEDQPEPEETPSVKAQDEDIATSSIDRPDSIDQPNAVAKTDPIGEPVPLPPPLPGAGAEASPPEPEAPVEIAAAPKMPAIAEADRVVEAVTSAPTPARPGIALKGERFDPADECDPIAVY
jgi:hypothetical protein